MKQYLLSFVTVSLLIISHLTYSQSPTAPALGFNVFTENNATLNTNESEGSVAIGGNLILNGNYRVNIYNCGNFTVGGIKVGLVVNGKIDFANSNGQLSVNNNYYAKIGDGTGAYVWYTDQNNATSPIRITEGNNYNSNTRIMLQANAPTLGNVSASNNPVIEGNLIDFTTAFATMRSTSTSISQNANNAQLTNSNGQSISNTNLSGQVKINMQNGVNYLNITGTDLNNVTNFIFNNQPTANKILVVNVNAPGTFNWNVWNQGGVGLQEASYIIYNFYNTTTLNILNSNTIEGTVFAPFADVDKTVNQGNLEGQLIAKSFIHSGGEMHCAEFTSTLSTCVTASNTTSTATITEGDTKTLIGTPSGGTWSIVSGGGTINGNTYTPADINTNTSVTIRYTIAADGSCAQSTSDVTFTVTPCLLGSIGNTVWYDSDEDAIYDLGEPGLENATITLDPGTPGNPNDDLTTTTDSNGNYLFDNLVLGNYTVTVDLSTVTAGIPSGKTIGDLEETFDADGVNTPNTSSLTLSSCENNLLQDFAYKVPSGNTGGGNNGGVESESLGDAISKIYVGRKKNSVPTVFVKDKSNLYNKSVLQATQPYQGKGQTMLDMFPTELIAGNEANVTSPTDILDYTIADEVLSVDFSVDGKTKGVVLGIKTSDKVYNHTKASCDRLRGAEILNIQKIRVAGYDFLMQGIKQRNGVVEYAISFAASKNNNDSNYSIQSNWYVNDYIKFNDMYNFQVWSTNPRDTQKLVTDIITNLKSFIPVRQKESQRFPETYASKIFRDKGELVVQLRSTKDGNTANIDMVELYSETANNIKHRNSSIATEIQQDLRFDIADGYEYDGLIQVDNEVEDAFYHADGNWGLDFDKRYTKIQNYFVWNNFNRQYVDDEYSINRNVELKATSDYDYLTLYKSLLPGTISADYSEYKYLAFTAKGSGLMELGLIKSSIEDWKQQYRIMVDLSEEEQTYYVPFEAFSSVGTQEPIKANDLTTLTFTFLPVEANTTELDLFISDVKFTKVAVEGLIVNKIEKFENEFVAYPNPSRGNVNILLFSKSSTDAEISLTDITGKEIYRGKASLTEGKNELDFNFNSVKTGIYLLKVSSKEADYGTSKLIIR